MRGQAPPPQRTIARQALERLPDERAVRGSLALAPRERRCGVRRLQKVANLSDEENADFLSIRPA